MAFKNTTALYRHPSADAKDPKARAETVHFGDGESSDIDKDGNVELPVAVGDATGWPRVKTVKAAKAEKPEPSEAEKFYGTKASDVVASVKKNDDKAALMALAALEEANPKGERASVSKAIADRLAELAGG